MPKIRPLPPETIAAIAAGEVIQRPVNVVKELVENALDAGAENISIHLEDSGLTLIEVIDDGTGIPAKQLPLAIQLHTTSKITQAEDLKNIRFHGFRGEALFSISQVAQVKLRSRAQVADAGAEVEAYQDQVSKASPVGMPQGTQVRVTDLFAQLPVRQEFLRRSQTELRRIVELITHFGLSQTHVGFRLTHGQRQLLHLPAGQTLLKRVQELFGNQLYSQLIPIDFQDDSVKITGFVSQPSLWTKRPEKQFLAANLRPIKHYRINKIITRISNKLQTNQLHPIYTLNLELPSQHLDVNIHPQKETVDFFQISDLAQALEQAMTPALTQRPLTYSSLQPQSIQIQDHRGEYRVHRFRQGLQDSVTTASRQKPKITGEIIQLANLYLIAPTTDGLLLIDQHALHEWILYDQYKTHFLEEKDKLLETMVPVSLAFDLSATEAAALESALPKLREYHLEIEPFGSNSFKLSQVPKLLADHDILDLIKEIIAYLDDPSTLELDSQTDGILASMACRAAIKAGDYISPEQRQELVGDLLTGNHPGVCPHGRPVSIRLSLSEFHKLFKRI